MWCYDLLFIGLIQTQVYRDGWMVEEAQEFAYEL